MRKNWWKVLGVVILIYTYTAGLLIPLNPGILSVNPSNLDAGESVVLEIVGYNTFFTKAKNEPRAWLKLDNEHAIQSSQIDIKSDTKAQIKFELPPSLPTDDAVTDASLIFDNDYDGAMVIPSKLTIKRPVENSKSKEGWTNAFDHRVKPKIRNQFSFQGYPLRNYPEHLFSCLSLVCDDHFVDRFCRS